jgi:aminopeptidase YwaD
MKRAFLSFVFILFILFPLYLIGLEGNLIERDLWKKISSEYSGELAKYHVLNISLHHRIRGGGPGYDAAVDYVVARAKEYGLEEVTVERFLADGYKSYLGWRSPVGWRVNGAELRMVKPYERILCRFSDIALSLMTYSNKADVTAELIDVGRGISASDYEGKDVAGKIVFATGDGATVHREAVIKRGAAGVVCTPSGREDRLTFPDLVEMHRLMPTGEEREKAGFGFALSERQAREIRRLLDDGKKVVLQAKVDAELFDGEMPVVTAIIRGRDFPDQEVIVIGHLDHYRPGANDNASGSAAMLELARTINTLISRGEIEKPKRTIRFLWVPEYHGTMAYLEKHTEFGKKGIAGINLDMVGENPEKTGSLFVLTKTPFSAPSYINDVMAYALSLTDATRLYSPRGSSLPFNYRISEYYGGSDHEPLSDSTIGVPTVMLGHTRDPFHHSSMDTVEMVDPTELRRVGTASTLAIYFIASAGDEEALALGHYISEQGTARLAKTGGEAIAELFNAGRKGADAEKLADLYHELVNRIEFRGMKEEETIKEAATLATSDRPRMMIEKIIPSFHILTGWQKERLDTAYRTVCLVNKISTRRYIESLEEKEAAKIVPVRLFRGSLPYDFLEENLSPADQRFYREYWRKDHAMHAKVYEILNFINGKRDLLFIRNAVSAEFGKTDISFVKRLLEDLAKLNLVTFKSK